MNKTKRSNSSSYLRRLFDEPPSVIFFLALVVGAFIAYRVWMEINTSFIDHIAIGIVNSVSIIILNLIFKQVAVALANWENH